AAGAPAPGTQTPVASVAPAATINVDPYAHEGVLYGEQIVNLPTGKPQRKGGIDFMIVHRFQQSVYTYRPDPNDPNDLDKKWSSLLGFDSTAVVGYGFEVGITNHVHAGFFRSNLDRTMEFNGMESFTRQGDHSPLTFAIREGIEFRNNFESD